MCLPPATVATRRSSTSARAQRAAIKYIRNYLPSGRYLQPNRYKDGKDIIQRLRELHAAGKLNELQEKLLFAEVRPPEELYDLQSDPYELDNLADDPTYRWGAGHDARPAATVGEGNG